MCEKYGLVLFVMMLLQLIIHGKIMLTFTWCSVDKEFELAYESAKNIN